MKVRINEEAFNPIYYQYLEDYSYRYNMYMGGSGSGKSHFITQKLIIKALQSKRKILIMRKVGRTIKDSVFALMLSILQDIGLYSYCQINKTNYTVTFPNGSTFLFSGVDDPEKLKSIADITDCWLEECSEFNEDDFLQIDLRLRSPLPDNQIYLSMNPISKANWTYKRFFADKVGEQWIEKKTPPQNTFILKTTYIHNNFLPQSYIDGLESLIETNPVYYRVYALGEFVSLDKLVYTNWKVGIAPIDKANLDLIVGLDFGYVNDPSALVEAYVDKINNRIYVTREMSEKGLLNNRIAARIKDMGLAKEYIVADSAEQKSIAELKNLGISRIYPASKGKGSILQGIQKLQQYEIIVAAKCINTIAELENYSWRKDRSTSEYINEPSDNYNHCLDALRYAIQKFDKQTKLKTMNKSVLGL